MLEGGLALLLLLSAVPSPALPAVGEHSRRLSYPLERCPSERCPSLLAAAPPLRTFQGQHVFSSRPESLRGGAGPLRSSAVVNFLTGEAVDEVTVVDVDSDDDMRGAKPVDWLPRGDFLLPEERRTLNDDRSDISDPEQGEQQSFLSKSGTRSKKASGFVLWKAKMSARYAAARARLEEAAAQVMLDMAAKYSCGLGEHWARRVLAGRRSRRRKEKREAAKLAKSGRKVRKSESPVCLPVDRRTVRGARKLGVSVVQKLTSLRRGAAERPAGMDRLDDGKEDEVDEDEEDEDSEDDDDSSDSLFSESSSTSSSSSMVEMLQEDDEGVDSWEASSEPWVAANITRPTKEEVDSLAQQVVQVAEDGGDRMPEVSALCRQCVRLGKVLSFVGDEAPTDASSAVLASLHDSLTRAQGLLLRILRPLGFSRRMIPLLLPVSSKLLRQVTESAAEISELLEEGADPLMDLLPVGVSMIISSGDARAMWRKWLGAHAISGSRKKMKCCLALQLSKAIEIHSSLHVKLLHTAGQEANLTSSAPSAPVPVPAHVVDVAAEALGQMSLCAQAPDEVDVLAWNSAFPDNVHMAVALEALVAAAHVNAPLALEFKLARDKLYGLSKDGGENDLSSLDSNDEEDSFSRGAGGENGGGESALCIDKDKDESYLSLPTVRGCGMLLLNAVIEDTQHVHAKADAVLNAVIMEYPVTPTKAWVGQREGLARIGDLVDSFESSMRRMHLARASRSVAPEEERERDELGHDEGVVARERMREKDTSLPPQKGTEGKWRDVTTESEAPGEKMGSAIHTTSGVKNAIQSPCTHPATAPGGVEAEQRRHVERLLFNSARAGHVGVCLFCILHCKISLDARGDRGNTALHLAAAQGHLDLVRTLRYFGADIFVANDEGLTPRALAERRGHKAVSSWFSIVASSNPEAGGPGGEETHVVLASLSRLAHVRPLPEPAPATTGKEPRSVDREYDGKVGTGVPAGADLALNLPSGPAGCTTVPAKPSLPLHELARNKDTAALNAVNCSDMWKDDDTLGDSASTAHGEVLSGHAALKGDKGNCSSTQLDKALAARPLSLGNPGLKIGSGTMKNPSASICQDPILLEPLPPTAAPGQVAKREGRDGEHEARAAGAAKQSMMPQERMAGSVVRKSSSSGSLSSGARHQGRSVSKSVSSSSLGLAQGRGTLRRADSAGDSALSAEAGRSGVGGDGKSSKWQFKFELSGILETPPTGAQQQTKPHNTTSARAREAPPVRAGWRHEKANGI